MSDTAMQAFSISEEHFQKGEYEAAVKRMDELLPQLQGEPLAADALNNKGYYLLHMARWQEAIDAFQEAWLIDPSFYAVLNHLAWTALLIQNQEGAEALLELFEKQGIEDRALHDRNLALYYTLLKEKEQALELISMAEEADSYLPYLDILKTANGVPTPFNYPSYDKQAAHLKALFSLNS